MSMEELTTSLNNEELTIKGKNGAISLTLCGGDTMRFKEAIKDYIDKFNNAEKGADKCEEYMCKAYICFHLPTTLHSSRKESYLFSQDLFIEKEKTDKHPIIHLTIYKEDSEKDEFYLRYGRIMDSSIWNYYVRIPYTVEQRPYPRTYKSTSTYNFDQLRDAVESIIRNSKDKLYDLAISHEYADLHARILQQSYLSSADGHGKEVSPFLFHSEQNMRKNVGAMDSCKDKILKYKWRVLLIDDHSEREMSAAGAKVGQIPTKLDIVKSQFEKLFGRGTVATTSKEDKQIYIECASSIDEAERKLKEKKYEIILLDYLLGETNNRREYGYELLEKIWNQKQSTDEVSRYKKGPHDRFYFMFISAFTTAVSERLLAEGWPRSKKFWYIGEGACPINTPYLFQYRLLHIMSKRIDDMGIYKLNGIQNDYDNSYVKKNIIEKIFSEDKDAGGIRSRANDYFHKVLSLLYHYKKMLDDYHQPKGKHTIFCSEESVIVTDFIMNNPNLGGLLEHLTQLVYLTAFGTVRQWPEMWEEYQFIKSVLGKIESIEKYIVKIKDNSI